MIQEKCKIIQHIKNWKRDGGVGQKSNYCTYT